MATLPYLLDHSDVAVIPRMENFHEVYLPKETIDQLFDVILVAENCKEFKAHSRVLSKASHFFEKLLNTDMKESKDRIIRLEMFSESMMQNMLEFIYTGNLQILNEDHAKDVIIMADYLFLMNLKTRAERVLLHLQKLNTSNCISAYHFSERYRCEELLIKAKTFIFENFTAMYKANSEVLNMSSSDIKMWISSDEINVSSEEDVFKIILAWIDHEKSKRKGYFAELFRELRLVFISRDFLCTDIVTNDLVTGHEECLARVWDAVSFIDSRNYDNLPVQPRQSLESPAIIITSAISLFRDHDWELHDRDILCYFTREDKWCRIDDMPHRYIGRGEYLSLQGKLYSRGPQSHQHCVGDPLVSYSLYCNRWMTLPYIEDWELQKIFDDSEDNLYALGSVFAGGCREFGAGKHVSHITKYTSESNSWEDLTSFDHLGRRKSACIVAKGNFIYLIGGHEKISGKYLTDVDRYDRIRNQWDKRAGIQQPKCSLSAAVANGKIFVSGRTIKPGTNMIFSKTYQCEVYSEIRNEWQIIRSFHLTEEARPILLSVDDKLYVLSTLMLNLNRVRVPDTRVECYDPEKDEWNTKTEVPILTCPTSQTVLNPYSVRIFKGFLSDYQLKSLHTVTNVTSCPSKLSGEARPNKHKCFIM